MIRIALCDDNYEFLALLKNRVSDCLEQLKQCLKAPKLQFQVLTFSSPTQLLEAIRDKENFDIILLDWDMPKMDGGMVGRYLQSGIKKTAIIYVTAYETFAIQAINLAAPLSYILKERLHTELPEALKRALAYLFADVAKKEGQYLICKCPRGRVEKIFLEDIIYIEHRLRTNYFYTENALITSASGESLKQFEPILEQNKFYMINRGLWVNFSKVIRYEVDTILLKNNYKLPISRNGREAILQAFMQEKSQSLA